jgi:hypothetical protein
MSRVKGRNPVHLRPLGLLEMGPRLASGTEFG